VHTYHSVDPCAEAATSPSPTRNDLSWVAVRDVAESMRVRDGTADEGFSTAAMDYFVDTARGVSEFARVLRPGGTLALLVTVHTPWVARARDGRSRVARCLGALRPGVLREVGLRGAASLAWDGARAVAREHTRYLSETEVLAALGAHFAFGSLQRDRGRYSTTLRVVASRRG
jgi:SAM-dependent methyltransferase